MESVVRELIKGVIAIAILLAIFLFSRIVFFSYGIDIKDILFYLYRVVRKFCKKISPFQGEPRNYRNYLKFKAI